MKTEQISLYFAKAFLSGLPQQSFSGSAYYSSTPDYIAADFSSKTAFSSSATLPLNFRPSSGFILNYLAKKFNTVNNFSRPADLASFCSRFSLSPKPYKHFLIPLYYHGLNGNKVSVFVVHDKRDKLTIYKNLFYSRFFYSLFIYKTLQFALLFSAIKKNLICTLFLK